MEANSINWITNLSATALQGAILWYLIVKAIPNIVADFRSEIAAERAHCKEELAAADARTKDFLATLQRDCAAACQERKTST